ncbi:hypothetical protein [Muribaculum intestinale]|uniref:hypothetical protein n=1 Tax=Muribaculum intestinale TaxID=1796646 RepID=UPI0025AFE217|nr:hypothetical protein [Muribaculum intestinale]
MNRIYKGIIMLSAVAISAATTGCSDDFENDLRTSGNVIFNIDAPTQWTGGNDDTDNSASRCISIEATDTSDGDTPLYLHTFEADNQATAPAAQSRGALAKSVSSFSLSAICYPGEYPSDEADITWTPDFAYNLTYTVNGSTAAGTTLQWPAGGKVRFFAFAPIAENSQSDAAGAFTLSSSTQPGSPKITYTVPTDVKKQTDIMAACTDATSPDVTLNFRHALTAVKIVAASDMLPGKITDVEISGVYGSGTFTPTPAGGTWVPTDAKATYKVTRDLTLSPEESNSGYKPAGDTGDKKGEIIGDIPDKTEITGETGDLTMLLIPQTLPEGARLTIKFTDDLTGTARTLSASLAGKTWPAGKIVTYSLSPSSIHITPTVLFSKDPATDVLPYSGAWHDSEIKAYVAVTQNGVNGIQYIELPRPDIEYSLDGGTSWESTPAVYDPDPASDATASASETAQRMVEWHESPDGFTLYKGTFALAPQSDFTTLSGTLTKRATCKGTRENPHNLLDDTKGETANCYLVDQPGYYCFPIVYGNAYNNPAAYTVNQNTTSPGMTYFVDYKCRQISSPAPAASDINDAVLAWQDAPDLIDEVEILDKNQPIAGLKWIRFRVRKHSITQGNALLVARDPAGEIVWSWHIWVTQHRDEWMVQGKAACHKLESRTGSGTSSTPTGHTYYLTACNLGYCAPHNGNDSRKIRIRFRLDCSKITGSSTPVACNSFYIYKDGKASDKKIDCTTTPFTQDEFKGSLGGDNTYYQWGRKDPMLGGIYNDKTDIYNIDTSSPNYTEMSMENKPTFNAYNKDGVSYDFSRNKPGTSISDLGEERGVTIDYTIKYPYRFVMSKYDDKIKDSNGKNFSRYRNHWHTLYKVDKDVNIPSYISGNNGDMFQMWNPAATDKNANEQTVTKSIYDPCPAGYHVPQANVFSALAASADKASENKAYQLADYKTSAKFSDHAWTVTYPGGSIRFPATGMRNMSLRYTVFGTMTKYTASRADDFTDKYSLKDQTYPAFRMITYVSTSSLNGEQTTVYLIDNRFEYYYNGALQTTCQSHYKAEDINRNTLVPATACTTSNNSYGLTVRPVHD